jgi:hypothetical protein
MTSRHSAFTVGDSPGAIYADRFAGCRADVVQVARDHRPLSLTGQGQAHREEDIPLDEGSRGCARTLHELRDTLFFGFLDVSMPLHQPVGQAADCSSSKPALSRILHLGCAAVGGIHTASPRPASLEQAFSDLLNEVTPERGVRLRIFVEGKGQALRTAIQEQFFLIGREAVVNALHHSKATKIEVEVQYSRCSVRMFVRDNGCGIDPDVVQKKSDSCWGLREMRDRAGTIGAQFGIWSRPGGGTEVRIGVLNVANR